MRSVKAFRPPIRWARKAGIVPGSASRAASGSRRRASAASVARGLRVRALSVTTGAPPVRTAAGSFPLSAAAVLTDSATSPSSGVSRSRSRSTPARAGSAARSAASVSPAPAAAASCASCGPLRAPA